MNKLELITAYDEMLAKLQIDLRNCKYPCFLHRHTKPTGISVRLSDDEIVEFRISNAEIQLIKRVSAQTAQIDDMKAEIMKCLDGEIDVL